VTPINRSADDSERHLTVAVDETSIDAADRLWLSREFPSVQFKLANGTNEFAHAVSDCDVVFGKRLPYEAIVQSTRVRWVQAGTAGVDALLGRGPWPTRIALTNARGAHGIPISEQVVAMMLAFATRLHVLVRAQASEANVAPVVTRAKWNLAGQHVLILGLGDIGEAVACRATALGMHVTGVRRSPAPTQGCATVVGQAEFRDYLPMTDHLVACLPLTAETHHIIGRSELNALPRGAHVYNVGRGAVIDGEALRRALADGHVGGAGLDCVEPSDIPAPGDLLWSHPDVILGQHTSGHSPSNSRMISTIFAGNLRRFIDGEPLDNVVDPIRGY
jgi:phosphoglycerate dehydrogenase-like enzyme